MSPLLILAEISNALHLYLQKQLLGQCLNLGASGLFAAKALQPFGSAFKL